MNSAAVTLCVVLTAAAGLTCYDVYLVTAYGVAATISWQTLRFCKANPVASAALGAALGLLSAHLFTDRTQPLLTTRQPVAALAAGVFAGFALGATYWVQRGPA